MWRAVPFPRRISVELTNHCNQRCGLCPRLGFSRPLGFMDSELFEGIARECAHFESRLWLHFLGEPLLHPRLVEMLRLAKQAGVRELGLSTNGVSLHGRLARELLDSGLDRLECSMDALDRRAYRLARGRDHFDRVRANVESFLALKASLGRERPITSIQFMRTPEIESQLGAIVESWRPWLGPRDFVMTIQPAPFGGAVPTAAAPQEDAAPRPPCAWLFESLVVLQDGSVSMCGADWDGQHPLGNLRDSSIQELWTGHEMRRRRRAHRAGRFEEVAPCARCEDWRLADGRGYTNLLDAGAPAAVAGGES